MITSDKPWKCLNCKRPAGSEQEVCTGCGDRLKAKGPGAPKHSTGPNTVHANRQQDGTP